MLQDLIVQRWREATDVDTFVQAITAKDVQEARDFFQKLGLLSSESEVREQLSQGDTKRNRNLAWLLFNDALKLDRATETEQIQTLLDWTSLIAEFRDALKYRDDALDIHCVFYQGVLEHWVEHPIKAIELYKHAETEYRNISASIVLQGIVMYAQGLAALERDNNGGSEGKEDFQRAMTLLGQGVPPTIVEEMQSVIDRALRQWQLVSDLMRTDQVDTLLDAHHELVDLELLKMLKTRTRTLAVNLSPVAEAMKSAQNAEEVARYIGQPLHFTDELLNFYMHSRQHADAIWILQERLKAHPDDLENQKKLAGILNQDGRYADAYLLLEEALKLHPEDATLHAFMGLAFFNLNNWAGAQTHSRRALELDPNVPIAAEVLGQIKEPQAAVSFQDGNLVIGGDISTLAPGELAAMMSAAMLAAHPEQIESFFAEASPDLAGRVAQLLQEKGLLPSQTQPTAEQYYDLAEKFFAQARWQEAIKNYRLTIEHDPNLAKAYMGLGDVYYRVGKYYLAIAYFEEALAIQPDPYAYRFLADTYVVVGKTKQAIEAYNQALKLNPNYRGARQSLQQLLEGREQK